jgi:CHASE2 domain-containing sensor protein
MENYALFKVLLGWADSSYPEIAAFCATMKFGLLAFGILAALIGWFFPTPPDGFS